MDYNDGLPTIEARLVVIPFKDYTPVYEKWRNQREWKWFYNEWLRAPVYPLKFPRGSTMSKDRALLILKDFGILPEGYAFGRQYVIPRPRIDALRKKLDILVAAETVQSVKPADTRKEDNRISINAKELGETAALLKELRRDLGAVTQERDALRKALEESNRIVVECAKERDELKKRGVAITTPSLLQPPPPPPPPAVMLVSKPELEKQTRDFLGEVTRGVELKKTADPEGAKKASDEFRGGFSSLEQAVLAKRRTSLSQGGDDDEGNDNNDLEWAAQKIEMCQMCYSKPVGTCVRCRDISYCSAECCTNHWESGHKEMCCQEEKQ